MIPTTARRHPLAALVVVAAAVRLSLLYRRLPLADLVPALRAASTLPSTLRRPELLLAVLEELLAWLPPRSLRPCLKRSLLALDLASRCGLSSRFHLGSRPPFGPGDGHAWVSLEGGASPASEPQAGLVEIFSA